MAGKRKSFGAAFKAKVAPESFRGEAKAAGGQGAIAKLRARIGQLEVERDLSARASGR